MMIPCPIDDRTETGVCLRLTHVIPRAEYDKGKVIMCQKMNCPVYRETKDRENKLKLIEQRIRIADLFWQFWNGDDE